MKRFFYNTIACCAALLTFAACEKTEDLSDAGAGSGAILINISSGDMTRAEKEVSWDFENRVDHLDVLIFDATIEDGEKVWHERIVTDPTTEENKVALTVKRSTFDKDKKYFVYVIANANDAEKAEFEKDDLTRSYFLKKIERKDPYIHLTGMPNENTSGIALPQNFLMDGAAYRTGEDEPMEETVTTTETGETITKKSPLATSVELNDGDEHNDTQLTVNLRRAAVKLVLNLLPGKRTGKDEDGNEIIISSIKFTAIKAQSGGAGITEDSEVLEGGYYVRNMPYTTTVAGEPMYGEYDFGSTELRTPRRTRNHYFDMHSSGPDPDDESGETPLIDKITVTAYTYAHSWDKGSTMEREPRWIVDVPLEYYTINETAKTGDRETATHETCYYQILLCMGSELRRNTCYTVNATVYTPGGTDPMMPVTLENVDYSVRDWIPEDISIGDEENRPKFLTVNRTEMEMHEIDVVTRETNGVPVRYAVDDTSVEFASSSPVTATVKRAYYIDKFGVEQEVSEAIFNSITLTPSAELNGHFIIESPVPVNNTARYIQVEIDNKDGMKRELTITQYAVINVTNIQGWYSYRSDFGGTTWENYANPTEKRVTAYYSPDGGGEKGNKSEKWWKFSASDYGASIELWTDYNGNYAPYRYRYGDPTFFTSEVADEIKPDENNNVIIDGTTYHIDTTDGTVTIGGTKYKKGESRISYYYYNRTVEDGATWDHEKQVWIPGNKLTKYSKYMGHLRNARMYRVEVTATSDNYTIGRPRITNGITDSGVDNAQLVSPSFLIASQLGTVRTITATNISKLGESEVQNMMADHCEQYVEVAKNGTVYGDWRLPTAAEIGIIIDLQYNTTEGAAMDVVMAGYKYYSASGIVINDRSTDYDYQRDEEGNIIRDENNNPVIKMEDGKPVHKDLRFLRCVHDFYKTQDTGKSGTQEAGN